MSTEIAIIDQDGLGPLMRALNPRQQRFIWELLEAGDDNHTRAYLAAGYVAANMNVARVGAHRLAHSPSILAAMREEALNRIHAGVIMATSELVQIASGRASGAKISDRLKAISMILNRAGIHEMTEHKVTVEHTADEAGMVARIKALASEMGLDPKKLLGNVVDAEFTVIEPSDGGIADLLEGCV